MKNEYYIDEVVKDAVYEKKYVSLEDIEEMFETSQSTLVWQLCNKVRELEGDVAYWKEVSARDTARYTELESENKRLREDMSQYEPFKSWIEEEATCEK